MNITKTMHDFSEIRDLVTMTSGKPNGRLYLNIQVKMIDNTENKTYDSHDGLLKRLT